MLHAKSTDDEVFDEESIKARRPPRADSSPSGVATGEHLCAISMPAPKVWKRTPRKPMANSVIAAEISTWGCPNENFPISPISEPIPSYMDEWSKEFLLAVELNEH